MSDLIELKKFLDGFVIFKRGKLELKPGQNPPVEEEFSSKKNSNNNNIILKKLRALSSMKINLKLKTLKNSNYRLSKR